MKAKSFKFRKVVNLLVLLVQAPVLLVLFQNCSSGGFSGNSLSSSNSSSGQGGGASLQCTNPSTQQLVNAGSVYYSFSVASGATQAICNADKITSTCDGTTGKFLPTPAVNSTCLVSGQTCAYTTGTGIATPTGNSAGSTVTGYALSTANYPTLCGSTMTSTCESSGSWSSAVPLYTACTQNCLNPDTSKPVAANSTYTYYTISSGTQAQCAAAAVTSTCQASTGLFSPTIATTRYTSCTPATAPMISSFSASQASITSGQSVTLSWSTSGATSLSISGVGAVTGSSTTVTPNTTTTYTLTATNSSGSATANVTVTVSTGTVAVSGAPIVAYTDILSGPNTGGENNQGIYLSIFGRNFGSNCKGVTACASSSTKVTIGGGSVAQIMYIGPSNGRPDIQQLSVQVGSNAKTGAIIVTNSVGASNSDQSFTVTAGNIYFVDNAASVGGTSPISNSVATTAPNDSNAGTILAPYRHIQNGETGKDATSVVVAGDFIVARGYSGQWAEAVGGNGSKTALWGIGAGSPKSVGGTAGKPVTLMGYPGEFPYFNLGGTISGGAGTAAYEGGIYPWNGSPNYINIVDIHIEAGGSNGAIDCTTVGAYWRVVNNEVTMISANSNTNEGGITGDSPGQFWVGNHIHDTAGSSSNQTHGIYVDGGGTYEISYNWIENINNGTGIQLYDDNGTNGVVSIANAHVHHNIIHNTLKYGINLAGDGNDDTNTGNMTNIVVWDNLVYNTGLSGLVFNYVNNNGSTPLIGALIYNNTFYNVCTSSSCTGGNYGAIDNDNGSTLSSNSVTLMNNIFVPHTGVKYYTDNASGLTSIAASNNLFYGGTGSTLGNSNVTTNPNFTSVPAATVASSGSLPNMLPQAGSPTYNAGSASVANGNNYAAMTYLSAFAGVVNDITLNKMTSGNPDIGCYQH